ncbi:MarR family transcriptional regulator [Clostridium sp. AF19-22AC]|uniref:DNA-binding MarR family transcriptional regulator n=2 Tax=Bacillota TaxID=1239 RepID=A0A2Y9BKD2_9FIRM|nr:MarR family transcriptional regulator [Faecalicatena orotica]PWJ28382.1 DNA-binding MarR family transcriptional regulator [Faecalicatena orotica]RHR27031.1 MarR family transcriptional regulator [Clostridium sp. AF19-22AC]SSA56838.1 DNA-binding transcriptional regulator, MarR family [Faecalicatena orotica]
MVNGMNYDDERFEDCIFRYVDQVKEFLAPEIWQNLLMDCSKNEIFVLWLLYVEKEVNMTRIAEYINVPLNTATGIVSRMEKRKLVVRQRSEEDKRIVTIRLGECGTQQIQLLLKEFMYYGQKVMEGFTEEELNIFFRMLNRFMEILKEEHSKKQEKPKVRKIIIE